MMERTITMRVRFALPRGMTQQEAQKYVKDAFMSHCGSLHQDDPGWALVGTEPKVAVQQVVTNYLKE